jgi:hypothetical protein
MKLRLLGTEAECARLAFLLRYGPPDLEVIQVSPPYANRGDRQQVRVYLELRFPEDPPRVDRTFYSLTTPDGTPQLVDAWGTEVQSLMAGPRHRGLRLDGPVAEFHRAVDRLRWDTVPLPLDRQPPSPPAPPRRRRDPSDGQTRLDEEAS